MIKKLLIFILLLLFIGCQHHQEVLYGYVEGEYVYIASNAGGDLKQLLVSRGQMVQKNQLLFQLDPEPQQAQLAQARYQLLAAQKTLTDLTKGKREDEIKSIEAQLSQAKASLVLSTQTLKRNQKLRKTRAISQSVLDEAIAAYQNDLHKVKELNANLALAHLGSRVDQILAQKEQVKAAKAKVNELTWALAQKRQRSPLSGLVFDTFYRQGEYVLAGQPVLALLAPQYIKIVFFIPQKLLSSIKVGQQIRFSCDGCRMQTAKITFINSQAEYTPPVIYSKDTKQNLVFRVEAHLPINVALRYHPGQPVEIFLPEK